MHKTQSLEFIFNQGIFMLIQGLLKRVWDAWMVYQGSRIMKRKEWNEIDEIVDMKRRFTAFKHWRIVFKHHKWCHVNSDI